MPILVNRQTPVCGCRPIPADLVYAKESLFQDIQELVSVFDKYLMLFYQLLPILLDARPDASPLFLDLIDLGR
jgi:hypothetical protein